MALPASGPISMSMVRTELQNDGKTTDLSLTLLGSMSGSGATRTLGYVPINQSSLTKPSSPLPASLSEWYSYDHSTNKACGNPLNLILGAYYSYVRYEVTGVVGSTSTTTLTLPTNVGKTIRCQIYTGSYPFTNTGTLTGTAVFDGTFTTAGSQYYSFNLASTSTILHVVAWDQTSPVGNYTFAVSPSCGTTSTTTTTTTIPPLLLTNGAVTCTGNSGSFTSTFSGGSGTYVTAALATSIANVNSLLNSGTGGGAGGRVISLSPGATSYAWTGVGSGSWYAGVKDSAAATNVQAISVNCVTTTTTTTTTTSTTTTTTTAAGNQVTVYSSAGDIITSGDEYNLYYSQDNVNWTYLAGPLSSTSCTSLSTVGITSGNIYVKAQRDSNGSQIYIRGSNSSTCPVNLNATCVYNAAITGTESVAITVYVDGTGDFLNCP